MSAAAAPDVVVTGLGVVTPVGVGVGAFWEALLSGRSGTDDLTLFDTSDYFTHRGGEVKDWAGETPRDGSLSRCESFALAASRMALEDAGPPLGVPPERIGVCFGLAAGNRPAIERPLRTRGEWRAPARTAHDPTRISRLVARDLGVHGPNLMMLTACAAGNSAVGHGMQMIRAGRADAMVVGGAEELSETLFMMFNRFRALAPERVQPFDRDRRGLMLAEGAGALLLESGPVARARGARIYGRVAGYGNLPDAHDMTAPDPTGHGIARSMRAALAMARVEPADLDYICAHGTGTPTNDAAEATAIRDVLGPAAERVPVSSIKSMMGHSLGASGAIEAVACLLAIRDGVIPPNMHLDNQDPCCEIRVAANRLLPARVDVVLNNSFGFGGNNACVVFASGERSG
ncbi:MAG TPA: beta-ketoacyl-[acyl-carrier-protein] synthase family protein [Candidatus Dormibacteraeota bacterium]|nr:beta-ketoacyl-[acyl-carrier-protein] synthase family protein [Candidatus Dormibacteraeota bacterium]